MIVTEISRARIREARKSGRTANLWKVRAEVYANPLVVKE